MVRHRVDAVSKFDVLAPCNRVDPIGYLLKLALESCALAPLLTYGWPIDVVININFPDRDPGDVPGIQYTRQGFRDEQIIKTEKREDLRGNSYFWIGYRGTLSNPDAGTDLKAIYEGYVSVTPLHVDLTHNRFLEQMRAWAS